MSDEEKKAIEELKACRTFWEERLNKPNLSEDDTKEAYEEIEQDNIILNLIEKQQKEIEELKVNNKKLQDKAKELIYEKQQLTSALLDSTPNDKIKAKMEELDNPLSETFKSLLNAEEPTWSGTIKQFLQSLLEKE